jgi:hypothetical protein
LETPFGFTPVDNLFPELQAYWNANSSMMSSFNERLSVITESRFVKALRSVQIYRHKVDLVKDHLKHYFRTDLKALDCLLSSSSLLRLFRSPWLVLANRGMEMFEKAKRGGALSGFSIAESFL